MNLFESVYQFTTEDISQYFDVLDLENKSVLTVGSSGDQAFNALLFGAGKVTLYDISPHTYEFVKLKKDIILSHPRKKAYKEIVKIKDFPINKDLFSYREIVKMNPCFSSDENYEKLREKLQKEEIEVITGDIFEMDKSLGDRKFDRIILSNILQYLDFYLRQKGHNSGYRDFLKGNFEEWISHLNDAGLMQLMYLYSVDAQYNEMYKVCDSLAGYPIFKYSFDNLSSKEKSAVLVYRKK